MISGEVFKKKRNNKKVGLSKIEMKNIGVTH